MSDVKVDYIGRSRADWRKLPYEVSFMPNGPVIPATNEVKKWLRKNVGTQQHDWDWAWKRSAARLEINFSMIWRFKTKESKALFVLTWTLNGN